MRMKWFLEKLICLRLPAHILTIKNDLSEETEDEEEKVLNLSVS